MHLICNSVGGRDSHDLKRERRAAAGRAVDHVMRWTSRADVENMSGDDIDSASGMVAVRLNDNYVQWPVWGRTVCSIACLMSKTKYFTNRGDKSKQQCFKVCPCFRACPQRPCQCTSCTSPF